MSAAITGLGAVSPLGLDAASTFEAAVEARSGVTLLADPEHAALTVRIAGRVVGLDAAEVMGPKAARRHARFTHLAVAAAREAIDRSGLRDAGYAPERIAVVLGVAFGGAESIVDGVRVMDSRGPSRLSPFGIPALLANVAPGEIATELGARGPCFAVASACASSAHAIGEALWMLRTGRADAVVAGGAEACLVAPLIGSFARMKALSRWTGPPEEASRPFDRERDGFVIAEGAAALVLERPERARARGAHVHAELVGYGASSDAHHVTQPDPEGAGMAVAMADALRDARVDPSSVEHVNAHGSGTPDNDRVETLAIRRVFGEHARSLWISSTKSCSGHLLGAAGALEALLCALAIERGVVPPTRNLDHPDPECDLDYVPHAARERAITLAMSNSFGFGGQNASLVLARAGSR